MNRILGKFWIILISSLFVSTIMRAQFIEHLYNVNSEAPQGNVELYGVGNSGFDSEEGFFNPHFTPDLPRFSFYGSANANIQSTSFASDHQYIGNAIVVAPSLSVRYRYESFLVQINFHNDLLLGSESLEGTWDFNGHQFRNPQFHVTNQILQIAGSFQIHPSLALTIGLSTNNYVNSSYTNTDVPFELSSKYFKTAQLLLGLNYRYNETLKFYLLGRSQASRRHLAPDSLYDGGANPPGNYPNTALVTFPGSLAYGAQYEISDRVKVSLEFLHSFVEEGDEIIPFYSTMINLYDRRSIWNNEIAVGLTDILSEHIKVGGLFSYYLKYDNNLLEQYYVQEPYGTVRSSSFYQAANPRKLAISFEYALSAFTVGSHIQFSWVSWTLNPNYSYGRQSEYSSSAITATLDFSYNILE